MAQSNSDISSSVVTERPNDNRDLKEKARQVARFTGFTDLGDLRMFLVSRPMLEVTAEILSDFDLANVGWEELASQFESGLRLGVVNLEQKYGENVDLWKTFPKVRHPDWNAETTTARNRPNSILRMAAWIFRLKNRIASYEKQDSSGRQTKYEKALNSFRGAIRNQEAIIPHCDPLRVKFPVLGPIMESNEINQVRPYHRVYQLWLLLATQSTRCAGPSHFFGMMNPFASEPVPVPDHTREIVNISLPNSRRRGVENLKPAEESPQKKQKLALNTVKTLTIPDILQLPVKKFSYKWLSDLDHQEAKDHLKKIEPQLQRTGVIDQDPTQARCCEFRNAIRRQFDFAKHKLQLHILEFQYPSQIGDASKGEAENLSLWEKAIRTLNQHPANSSEEVVLIFAVRLLRENERLLESVRKPAFLDLMSVDDRY